MGIVIIFTIVLIIGILLLILYRKFFPYEDNLLIGSIGCITLGGILFIALSISILIIQSNNKPLAAQYEQEYNDIIMALSQNEKKGLSEAGKNILIDRAIDYNKKITYQKTRRESFWYGAFAPKVYEELPLIDLEEFT